MASIIKVDTIQTAAGGTPTAADLGINTTGTVLQVVHSPRWGDGTEINTTSTSFTATGHTASITLSSASNKILILGTCVNYQSTSGNGVYVTAYRSIGGGASSDIFASGHNSGFGWLYTAGGDEGAGNSFNYLDSPNTTSEVTYEIYYRVTGGTGYYCPNRSGAFLTLMEIAG